MLFIFRIVIFVNTLCTHLLYIRSQFPIFTIIIGDRVLSVNLAVFQMLGFDIIFRMDWLSKYYANIDCRKQEVIFRSPSEEEFKVCGSRYEPLHLFFLQFKRDGALDVVRKHF